MFVNDDDLAALALAADPEAAADEVAGDVPSLWDLESGGGRQGNDLLPSWYMPSPMLGAGTPRRWWRWMAIAVILAFVALNAAGLCSTYGRITLG